MNPFRQILNDEIFILDNNGNRNGPFKTAFNNQMINVFEDKIDVEEGNKIIRPIPNGRDQIFTIIEVEFTQGLMSIPPHFILKIKKDSSLVESPKTKNITNVNISKSQGFQVGDHNIQNITDSFHQLIEKINSDEFTPQEKNEAKSKIKELLTNPTIGAILGRTVSGLLALL